MMGKIVNFKRERRVESIQDIFNLSFDKLDLRNFAKTYMKAKKLRSIAVTAGIVGVLLFSFLFMSVILSIFVNGLMGELLFIDNKTFSLLYFTNEALVFPLIYFQKALKDLENYASYSIFRYRRIKKLKII